MRGNKDEAVKMYHLAIKVDPTWAPSYYQLAHLLRRTGRASEADEVLKQIPEHAEPHENKTKDTD
jgi:tetratricopeptide (TPR) repeat protein